MCGPCATSTQRPSCFMCRRHEAAYTSHRTSTLKGRGAGDGTCILKMHCEVMQFFLISLTMLSCVHSA